jgi:hypothetical protein
LITASIGGFLFPQKCVGVKQAYQIQTFKMYTFAGKEVYPGSGYPSCLVHSKRKRRLIDERMKNTNTSCCKVHKYSQLKYTQPNILRSNKILIVLTFFCRSDGRRQDHQQQHHHLNHDWASSTWPRPPPSTPRASARSRTHAACLPACLGRSVGRLVGRESPQLLPKYERQERTS